ncbi:RhoGEF domain-containing protein, partial [Aphelenchoides avenae]
GDLRLLGPLRLQTECDVFTFKRKTRRMNNKAQKRHLFLFDGGVLFCKKRTQPVPYAPEYYEHKLCIPIHALGFAECSKSSSDRFEVWDETKSDGFAIQTVDEAVRAKWIQRLARLTVLHAAQQKQQQLADAENEPSTANHPLHRHHSHGGSFHHHGAAQQSAAQQQSHSRPQSWTSTESTVSSRSSAYDDATASTSSHTEGFTSDPNGNPSPTHGLAATTTTGSTTSRRSSNTSAFSDFDNNPTSGHVTTIQIPSSRSLQNAHLLGM